LEDKSIYATFPAFSFNPFKFLYLFKSSCFLITFVNKLSLGVSNLLFRCLPFLCFFSFSSDELSSDFDIDSELDESTEDELRLVLDDFPYELEESLIYFCLYSASFFIGSCF